MWYDFFSLFYDRSLERLYAPARAQAIAALRPDPGSLILDLGCGTGQNFPVLREQWQPGRILGVDVSSGMLRQAEKRVQRERWENVTLLESDVHALTDDKLEAACGRPDVDAIFASLAFSLFDRWEAAFETCYSLLRPGGRMAIFDVFAERRTFQTWSTELVSRGDLSRPAWNPLEAVAAAYEKSALPGSPAVFGGGLYVAAGTKPESP